METSNRRIGHCCPSIPECWSPSRFAVNLLLRLHRWSFRLSGLNDGARVVVAAAGGTGTFILALFLLRVLTPPRSVVVLELLVSAAGMVALRFAPRLGWTYLMEFDRFRRGTRGER
jgi:hypothetical protein